MGANEPIDMQHSRGWGAWLEHAPSPMTIVVGEARLVQEANAAFCRLIDRVREDVVGKPLREVLPDHPRGLALVDEVYSTGLPPVLQGESDASLGPVFSWSVIWPFVADDGTSGAVIQVTKGAPLDTQMRATNEALLLGSLRQHELAASAEEANRLLKEEMVRRLQSEHDALMLTHEMAHRITNNLQNVIALTSFEAQRIPTEFASGYAAMEARILAIAELYNLISRSDSAGSVMLDKYLIELTRSLSASLLQPSSRIRIEVAAAPLEIDADRAVAFGLAVNELATNAIKHAFLNDIGLLKLSLTQSGDQIELVVADNGVGLAANKGDKVTERHGSDYVAIFVRQLGGSLAVSSSAGKGTTIRILFPANPRATKRFPMEGELVVPDHRGDLERTGEEAILGRFTADSPPKAPAEDSKQSG